MKRAKVWTALGFAALFLIFLFIMDYPFLARLINSRTQGEVVVDYQAKMEKIADPEKEQMILDAKRYNESLVSGLVWNVESPADSLDEESEEDWYQSLLNSTEEGIMGTVEIPKIKVNLSIYHGTSETVLQQGAGHLYGSSLPAGGVDTHVCISAHRGLVGKTMFTNLDELKEGDIFLLHVLDETLCYRIRDIYTILPDEVESLKIRKGEELVTLITCTPYGINTHRLCVEGYRIPYTEDTVKEIEEKEEHIRLRDWWWMALTIILLGCMLWMIFHFEYGEKDSTGKKRGEGQIAKSGKGPDR